MGHVFTRGKKLYLDFVDAAGKRKQKSTGLEAGQEDEAEELLRRVERKVAAQRDLGDTTGAPSTVRAYGKKWIERRKRRVTSWRDERGWLRNHVYPELGGMRLDRVRPRHIRDLVLELREKRDADGNPALAPRSIINIYGVLQCMFKDAVIDELCEQSPCSLPRGVLPPRADADPEWRADAVFSHAEVERLISDERILPDRRVLYALKALAGLRHGEAAGLRFRHWTKMEPLGRLTVANSYTRPGTKTHATRLVPVHPALAAILAEWKLSGWAEVYGREPGPEDLVVPTRNMTARAASDAAKYLKDRDLPALKLRPRRGHDLRATFITLLREDGAEPQVIHWVTHTRPRDAHSGYVRYSWQAVCREVERLRIRYGAREEKVARTSAATGSEGEACDTSVTVDENAPQPTEAAGLSEVTPTGFENETPRLRLVGSRGAAQGISGTHGAAAPSEVGPGGADSGGGVTTVTEAEIRAALEADDAEMRRKIEEILERITGEAAP